MGWIVGRQNGNYFKKAIFILDSFFKIDCYLLKYGPGSYIDLHVDPVSVGKHYRLNIILTKPILGGIVYVKDPIFNWRDRIILFRPDVSPHAVSKIWMGKRYVLSIGWIRL